MQVDFLWFQVKFFLCIVNKENSLQSTWNPRNILEAHGETPNVLCFLIKKIGINSKK